MSVYDTLIYQTVGRIGLIVSTEAKLGKFFGKSYDAAPVSP